MLALDLIILQVEKEETKTATINIKVLKQRPAKLTAAETLLIEEKKQLFRMQ
jgi:hypothetical protein